MRLQTNMAAMQLIRCKTTNPTSRARRTASAGWPAPSKCTRLRLPADLGRRNRGCTVRRRDPHHGSRIPPGHRHRRGGHDRGQDDARSPARRFPMATRSVSRHRITRAAGGRAPGRRSANSVWRTRAGGSGAPTERPFPPRNRRWPGTGRHRRPGVMSASLLPQLRQADSGLVARPRVLPGRGSVPARSRARVR